MAQDIYQADQAAVWPEPVPNALAHFWQRASDRLRPGVPASRLSHLEARLSDVSLNKLITSLSLGSEAYPVDDLG